MSDVLRFIGVTKDALTAGPGKRLELFTKGCIRGVISPCEGCFNKSTWTFEGKYRALKINEVLSMLDRDAWNRQVTFCGGEPILQGRALIELAKRMKQLDPNFHIVMYTMYKLDVLLKHGLGFIWNKERDGEAMYSHLIDYSNTYEILKEDSEGNPTLVVFKILSENDVYELMSVIDIIVDGEYKHDLRLTNHKTMHDGGFIGSANQRVIFAEETIKNSNNRNKIELEFLYADKYMEDYNQSQACKCCGSKLKTTNESSYCNNDCKHLYEKRHKEGVLR